MNETILSNIYVVNFMKLYLFRIGAYDLESRTDGYQNLGENPKITYEILIEFHHRIGRLNQYSKGDRYEKEFEMLYRDLGLLIILLDTQDMNEKYSIKKLVNDIFNS